MQLLDSYVYENVLESNIGNYNFTYIEQRPDRARDI